MKRENERAVMAPSVTFLVGEHGSDLVDIKGLRHASAHYDATAVTRNEIGEGLRVVHEHCAPFDVLADHGQNAPVVCAL